MSIPPRVRRALSVIAIFVPAPDRDRWICEWQAELSFHYRADERQAPARLWFACRLASAARHAVSLRWHATTAGRRGPGLWTGLTDDLRYAARAATRTPLFSLTVVLTMALGVGLIAGILAFADGYLFRPLPFPGADRVYYVRDTNAAIASALTATDTRVLRESPLAHYGFVEWGGLNAHYELTIDSAPVSASFEEISPGFRRVLELPLRAGRDFVREDHAEGAPLVAWVSHRFWRRGFGGDPELVNRVIPGMSPAGPIELRIVGILGPEVAAFDGNNAPPDFVIPARGRRHESPLTLSFPLVRLPNETGVDQATLAISAALQAAAPAADGRPRLVRLSSFDRAQRGGGAPTARLLFAGALLVMLLASMNLIHLFLGRGEARTSEAATRLALGASRWRVTRAFLVESLLLGAAGIALGLVGGKLLAVLIESRLPGLPTAGRNLSMMPVIFDGRVMGIAAVLGLLAGMAGGLWPARRAWRASLETRVRGNSRGTARLARAILASELAVVTVVAAGAVFAGTGIYRYLNKPLGFAYEDRVQVYLRSDARLPQPDILAALDAVRSTSGVRAAALEDVAIQNETPIAVPGRSVDFGQLSPSNVPRGLFESWGWKMVAGRWFTEAEYHQADVAVVNEQFANAAWPDGGAIGATIRVGAQTRQVIGVMQSHQWRLDMPLRPQVFVPAAADAGQTPIVAWAPGIAGPEIESRIEAAIESAVPGLKPRAAALTFEQYFARGIGEARFQRPLVTAFAVLGAILALVGVFGIASFLVTQRTREFGIRLALGAQRHQIRLGVLRDTLFPATVGVALGTLGAWILSRVIEAAAFNWQASGAQTIAIVVSATLIVTITAALVPAGRAARTDPATTLRRE